MVLTFPLHQYFLCGIQLYMIIIHYANYVAQCYIQSNQVNGTLLAVIIVNL